MTAVPRKRPKFRSEARGAPGVKASLGRLGKRIREIRTELGVTQEKVAEKAKLDPKHLQAIEAGQVNVTVASLIGLSKALHVKLADLFEGV